MSAPFKRRKDTPAADPRGEHFLTPLGWRLCSGTILRLESNHLLPLALGVFAWQEAELQVSKAHNEDGRVIQSGLSIRVTPEHLRTPFDLALRLTLGRLTDPLMTHHQRPPSDMFDPSSTFVLSTNLSIPEGMTAILGDPFRDPTARTNYLVLITASYLDSAESMTSPLIGPEFHAGPAVE